MSGEALRIWENQRTCAHVIVSERMWFEDGAVFKARVCMQCAKTLYDISASDQEVDEFLASEIEIHNRKAPEASPEG
jgi:hypothetical protein